VLRVDKSWQAVLKAAKIERFRWHDLRHHFASRLVQRGVDLNTVRELLGHVDISMTLRYSHLAPEQKAAAVAKLAALTLAFSRRRGAQRRGNRKRCLRRSAARRGWTSIPS
jgi:integrase